MENNNHCIKSNEIEFGTDVIIKFLINRIEELQKQIDEINNKLNNK